MVNWEDMTSDQRFAHNLMAIVTRINDTGILSKVKAESDQLVIRVTGQMDIKEKLTPLLRSRFNMFFDIELLELKDDNNDPRLVISYKSLRGEK